VDPPLGAKSHETGRHLAAAGVLDADEEHLRAFLRDRPIRLGRQRLQALACEAVGEHRDERVDLRLGQQVDGLGDVALDCRAREDPRELVDEAVCDLRDVMMRDRVERGHISSVPDPA
jgi:hypothetical protein